MPTPAPRSKWRKIDGEDVMPDLQREYLDWLIDPDRTPPTHKQWAADHEITDRTVRTWRNDPRFQREWAAAANEANVSPERTQAVVENLWKIASSAGPGAVKAADLYLRYVQLFVPQQKVVVQDDQLDKISDEDIVRLLQDG